MASAPASLTSPHDPATLPGTEVEADDCSIPCRVYDADLWFDQRPEQVELAKALCGPCPLRTGCLAAAVERAEPWGVWGGQLIMDGVVVARKRGRGRPRREPSAA